MTDEQIEKLAGYIVYLRGRYDDYYAAGCEDMVEYIGGKLEAAREIAIVFECREEVFRKVEEMWGCDETSKPN